MEPFPGMVHVTQVMELDPLTLARAQRGEPRAQEAFLLRYARPLRALVARAGAPGRDPDDALQDLFIKLLAVLPQFKADGPASLSTWVFTVAHRALLESRRKKHLELVELDDAVHPVDPAPRPDAVLERRELSLRLEAALATLPLPMRRVWVLARVNGQSLEAIATAEGIELGTVKSRLHRARALLVLALRADGHEGEGGTDVAP